MIRIGHTNMKRNHLVDNILQVTEILAKKYPGGWKNIRSINLKTETSMAIPIHLNNINANEIGFIDTVKPKDDKKENITDELSTVLGATVTVRPNFDIKIKGAKMPKAEEDDFDDEESDEDDKKEVKNEKKRKMETKDVKLGKKKAKKAKKDEASDDEDEDDIANAEDEYLKRTATETEEKDDDNEDDEAEEDDDDDEDVEEGEDDDEDEGSEDEDNEEGDEDDDEDNEE